ncbi:NADH dehydrogenase [ubiquinone] 1 beta subcomplex subunit 2, mitochondrial-like [Lytechinus variegatus]|uniref:NADH dehydrogenase [ubiquinone] 1 beta subcomplex subunit 2, mitochondrial-like n=1 Tax=Lytechinus variegatus TaxID=7654 RepID=UPI001BB10B83|nr:NADH dehydrogenase [ubiquinone] 1 beta subcomplex subunit 2, mitochondrial-like [Lytechinus variegatus]
MFGLSRINHGFRVISGVKRVVPCRNGSAVYRGATAPSRTRQIQGMAVVSAMWFWILWRFYHEPADVFGHFEYPDPSKWTDAELGIPPDDED